MRRGPSCCLWVWWLVAAAPVWATPSAPPSSATQIPGQLALDETVFPGLTEKISLLKEKMKKRLTSEMMQAEK